MILQESPRKIYFALNHPLRRWIVELLEASATLDFFELRSLLNIDSGRLYYHLDNLTSLVEQDEDGRYMLSKEGKKAYQLLNASTI